MRNASSDFSLLYLHDYLLGPEDAGSSRAWETLHLFKEAGVRVHAITSGYNPLTRQPVIDPNFGGCTEIEHYLSLPPCNGRILRMLGLSANALFLTPSLLRKARTADLLYFSSPPLTSALALLATHLLCRIPYVVEVRDLWPAAGTQLGIFAAGSLPERVFSALESSLLRRARGAIALTRGIAAELRRQYPKLPIATVPNGVLRSRMDAAPELPRFERKPYNIAYFGNFTASSDPPFAIALAEQLGEMAQLHLAGDGRCHEDMRKDAGQRRIQLEDHGPIAHRLLPEYLARMDCSLVPILPDPFFRCVVSNKLLESMAAGLPVLLVGDGESADIVHASGGGIVVPRGEEELSRTAEAFQWMAAHPAEATAMGKAGQAFLRRNFCREELTRRLLERLVEWR